MRAPRNWAQRVCLPVKLAMAHVQLGVRAFVHTFMCLQRLVKAYQNLFKYAQ